MPEEIVFAKELDLRGLQCPMPMVRVSKEIVGVAVGEVLKAVATDPAAKADISAWARLASQEVVRIDEVDGELVFYIRRVV